MRRKNTFSAGKIYHLPKFNKNNTTWINICITILHAELL